MSCERGWLCIGACLVLLVAVGCTVADDDESGRPSPAEGLDVEELLGPDDPASGEPVRIGLVSDGATPTFDNTRGARWRWWR
jgi:hypothetical protein